MKGIRSILFIAVTVFASQSFGQFAPRPLRLNSDYDFQSTLLRNKDVGPTAKTFIYSAVGKTHFDLQTHGAERNRIVTVPGAGWDVVWNEDLTTDYKFSGRGTGFERYLGGPVSQVTDGTLETGIRTGYPNILLLADSNEVVINHADTLGLRMWKRHAYSITPWVGGTIADNTQSGGILWPIAVSGGNNGMSIHVIGLTTPSDHNGNPYKGLDGALVYYRSEDGGNTWNITDSVLTGLDSSTFLGFNADMYSITARDSIVAIGLFGVVEDAVVLKSTDNGNTWTKTIVNDFPLDKYVADQMFGTDINGDSIADTLWTTDGAGSLLIDGTGNVHAWWGALQVLDKDFSDGVVTYLPTSSGLRYWKESFGADSSIVIADLHDADTSGTFDFASGLADYQTSLTSFPTSAIASSGSIHVFYSALVEDEQWNSQQYRHVFVTNSEDGGSTWSSPKDLSGMATNIEAVFPSVTKYADTTMVVTFQVDGLPGLATRGDYDPITTNNQVVMLMDTADLVGIEKNSIENNFNVYPVPSSGLFKYTYTGNPGIIVIGNVAGRVVLSQRAVGRGEIDLTTFPAGVYFATIFHGDGYSTKKLVITR